MTPLDDGPQGPWRPGKARVGGPIRSGHLLFVGGIGGWYPDRRPEGPGDVRQQAGDALEILKASLERGGTSMAHVLHVQIALVNPAANGEAMDEVFNRYFPEPRPVCTAFGSAGFRRAGQLLQVDCIARVD